MKETFWGSSIKSAIIAHFLASFCNCILAMTCCAGDHVEQDEQWLLNWKGKKKNLVLNSKAFWAL